MKRLLTLLMALAMTASLAACGGTGSSGDTADSGNSGTTAEGGETAGSSGVEDGVLTIAMECAYAPYNWSQSDDSNGAVPISNVPGTYANGYDVMIAKKICEANGWELEIVSSAWDSLCPAVQSGTMDANIAGQSMTADRMAQVDMAGPYYYADIVCLTTAGSAYAAAHEQVAPARRRRERETIAQGQQAVHRVACCEAAEGACAVADFVYEQPELVPRAVDEVDGDRAAQERRRRVVHAHFDKLARQHVGQWARRVGEPQQHVGRVQSLRSGYGQVN